MRVWVSLPAQYDQPAYAHRRFPVVMLYPGGSGAQHNAWVGPALGARELVDRGSRDGTISPFVLVMPEMQVSPTLDTECADLPGQPAVGTFLAVDVPRLVAATFRVLDDRHGWGAAGISSGAYCAARLVFDHPDQYAAVASLDGYFTIQTDLPGAKDPRIRSQDPWAVAETAPPDVAVLLWSGGGPDLTLSQQFLAHVKPPTRAELRVLPGGQHLTEDVAKMVPGTFAYLTTHLSQPH